LTQNKEEKPGQLSAFNSVQQNKVQANPIYDVFEDQLYTELFTSRCHDTGETSNSKQAYPVENAKLFKEDLLRRNVKNSNNLNLQSLRLGINAIISLSNSMQFRKLDKLNLADNAISDYGMHAIKNILNNSGYAN
jgi:hypothetical protein